MRLFADSFEFGGIAGKVNDNVRGEQNESSAALNAVDAALLPENLHFFEQAG
jgi:hypothetical protein